MTQQPQKSTLFPYTTLFRSEDIKRYRVEYKNRYLIFTKRGIDLNNYKAIAQHLLQFKAQLEPKPADWDDKIDRKSTRLNSSHLGISYAVFCLKKKKKYNKII